MKNATSRGSAGGATQLSVITMSFLPPWTAAGRRLRKLRNRFPKVHHRGGRRTALDAPEECSVGAPLAAASFLRYLPQSSRM